MRRIGSLLALMALLGAMLSLAPTGATASGLDGGTTCRTYGTDGVQSIAVTIGDNDSRTVFQFRNGRLIVDGTSCGRVLGRGIVDVLDGGEASTNTLVFDASTRWSTGGDFTIPVGLNLRGHIQDGRPDRIILRGSAQRDLVDASGSGTLSMRRGGQFVFSTNVETSTLPIVDLRGGNDRFRYPTTLGTRPFATITVKGGPGNDVLIGNSAAERFVGGPGNDRLIGRGGDDDLSGGGGRDRIVPGGGADRVNGGSGVDSCACRANDTVTNVP